VLIVLYTALGQELSRSLVTFQVMRRSLVTNPRAKGNSKDAQGNLLRHSSITNDRKRLRPSGARSCYSIRQLAYHKDSRWMGNTSWSDGFKGRNLTLPRCVYRRCKFV